MGTAIINVARSLLSGLVWVYDNIVTASIQIGTLNINAGLLIGGTALSLVALVAGIKIFL